MFDLPTFGMGAGIGSMITCVLWWIDKQQSNREVKQ